MVLFLMIISWPFHYDGSDNWSDDEDIEDGDEDGEDVDDSEDGEDSCDIEDGIDDNLVVVPLPKNFMRPPSIMSQKHRGM